MTLMPSVGGTSANTRTAAPIAHFCAVEGRCLVCRGHLRQLDSKTSSQLVAHTNQGLNELSDCIKFQISCRGWHQSWKIHRRKLRAPARYPIKIPQQSDRHENVDGAVPKINVDSSAVRPFAVAGRRMQLRRRQKEILVVKRVDKF